MKTLVLILTTLLLPGCAAWKALFPEPPPAGMSPRALRIPAAPGHATGIALAHFLEREKREAAETLADPAVKETISKSTVSYIECFLRPEAYEAYLDLDQKREVYRVTIFPVPEVCLGQRAGAMHGGGAKYEIDAHSYAIRKSEVME